MDVAAAIQSIDYTRIKAAHHRRRRVLAPAHGRLLVYFSVESSGAQWRRFW